MPGNMFPGLEHDHDCCFACDEDRATCTCRHCLEEDNRAAEEAQGLWQCEMDNTWFARIVAVIGGVIEY